MTASAPELAGMLIACGGAAAALITRSPRVRYAAVWVALLAAPALVAGDVWHQTRFADLRAHPALLALALMAVAGVVIAVAAAFERFPRAFPMLVFAALALRVPVRLGGETSNLLVPLYLVIAGEAAHRAYPVLRGRRAAERYPDRSEPATWLLRLLAATLVLYALQSAYSEDVSNAIENAGFFLVPFAVLLVLLLEVDWTPRLLGTVLAVVGAAALVFVAVGFWEHATRDLLLNKQLLDANQLHTYFRVNSLFHDPNVLGRYLALTIVALAAYVAWNPDPRAAVAASAAGVLSLAVLVLSYSLTSFAALIVGLVVVAWLRWGSRAGLAAGAVVVVVGGFYLLVTDTTSQFRNEHAVNVSLEGRVNLVRGGIELAGDRPVWGWGSGSFGAAFERHIQQAQTTTSHSEPITVAAEQGGVALGLYLALLAAALATLLAGASTTVGRTAVAGCFVAMVVHSMGYAGFLTDPATWALLALGLALPAAAAGQPAARPAPE
jgi:putative inorganic carbon (HCO3(-)) transporter